MSGDVTSGELPPTRAARRAADQAETRHRRRALNPLPAIQRRVGDALKSSKRAVAAPDDDGTRAGSTGPRPIRHHARVIATVLVVPALVGTVALPAYAAVQGTTGFAASDAFSLSRAEAQNVDVSSFAADGERSSDAYAVQTKAEIDAEAARVAAAQRSSASSGVVPRTGAYYIPAQQAPGDDYPYWDQTPDDFGGGLSPLGYYYRECVDFVAWRLNRDAGATAGQYRWVWSNLAQGSASAWYSEWDRHQWQTSKEPIVGSVAWFPRNHVAYVQAVNGDGTVTIEEYNQNSDHSYHVRTISIESVGMFLYPPV